MFIKISIFLKSIKEAKGFFHLSKNSHFFFLLPNHYSYNFSTISIIYYHETSSLLTFPHTVYILRNLQSLNVP